MAAQGEFLAKLKGEDLLPQENDLREALTLAATLASEFLPRHVALQDWVESRMPGEIQLGCNAGRRVTLRLAEGAGEADAEAAGGDSDRDRALFLKGLPGDSFLQEEDDLREALLESLSIAPDPLALAQDELDPRIADISRDFLPSYVHLADWIEWRIGREVTVFTDKHGQRMAKLGQQPGATGATGISDAQRLVEFFATLPADSYTRDEERLRDVLFDIFASWQSQELATLGHIGCDKDVKHAKNAFLPQGVSLRDWIERRMGGELDLRKDARGKVVVDLTPAAHPRVRERYEAKKLEERRFGDKGDKKFKDEPLSPEELRQQFYGSLPAKRLTGLEQELLEGVLQFLESWDNKNPDGPAPFLSDAGSHPRVRAAKTALLTKGLSFKEWIDRRINKEISTKRHSNGQFAVFLRGSKKMRGPQENQGRDSARPERTEADHEEERKAKELMKEAFFDTLPENDFSQEEQDFRQALLAYLDHIPPGGGPAELQKAAQDPEVQRCKQALLPKACGVSIQSWIDRRIGGEIETRVMGNQGAGSAIFGLRGQLRDGPPHTARAPGQARERGPRGPKRKGPSDLPGAGGGARRRF